MLIRNIRGKKLLAAFFLSLLAFETFCPSVSYALTSGPVSPETSSFEPVDTTDMVNLQTGDFTYNLPVLEVPGPEGGYPMSLSYHAGVPTNEDASWVGLGWTLNPGSINRNVNGYADDWDNVSQNRRDYWSGVSGGTFGLEVGIGLGPANVTAGLTISQNNVKGRSIEFKPSVGLGANIPILKGTSTIGVNIDLMEGASAGIKVGGSSDQSSSLGITLSSGGGGAGVSMRGAKDKGSFTGFFSSSAGKINSESRSGAIFLPFKIFTIGLKSTYYRQWSDNSATVNSFGSLYTNNGLSATNYNSTAFDTYFLTDENYNMFLQPDLEYQVGGAMPDFDDYVVNAQGINGTMRPYMYRGNVGGLNRGNKVGGNNVYLSPNSGETPATPTVRPITYKIAPSIIGTSNPKANFRFVNDFSNSYRQGLNTFTAGSLTAPFDPNPVYGDGILSGYDATNNYLEGSKHIEYFTNQEILAGTAKAKGFVNVAAGDALGYTRGSNSRIGGFSVTAANGVTYHFALPADNKGEMTWSEKIKESPSEPTRWTKQRKTTPYTYTWHLTSITGPDFVDRDNNGVANDGDFGYYVNFGYGLWCGTYNWRTPGEDYQRDVDNEFQNYSHGQKEVYYLNTIKTRTHTAIFEKDVRNDARSVASAWTSVYSNPTSYYGTYDAGSRSTMRLNRVLLMNNADAATVDPANPSGISLANHNGQYVIDKLDLLNTGLESKCMKIVAFEHDYSLCPKTVNSFSDANVALKTGKLTLKALNILGKGGVSVLPPIDFDYEQTVPRSDAYGPLTQSATPLNYELVADLSMVSASGMPVTGELVYVKTADNNSYLGYVTSDFYNASTQKYYYTFKTTESIPATYLNTNVSLFVTKNPPYNKDAYDKWGYYKVDANLDEVKTSANTGRMTSVVSAPNTDVWSLRKISTQLGANILVDYESDTYSNAAVPNRSTLVCQDFVKNQTAHTLTFKVNNPTRRTLTSLFPLNSKVDMLILQNALNWTTGWYLSIPFMTSTLEEKTYFFDATNIWNTEGTYNSFPMNGVFTVLSINEAASTVTIRCMDDFFYATLRRNVTMHSGVQSLEMQSILAGNIYYYDYLDANDVVSGGGIRVKQLSMQDEARKYTTKYSYKNKYNAGLSSGITSYEPHTIESHIFEPKMNIVFGEVPHVIEKFKAEYRYFMTRNYGRIVTLSRDLPGPGVIYEYVSTSSEVGNIVPFAGLETTELPGRTEYQFTVPNLNSVTYTRDENYNTTTMGTRSFSIVDNTAAIGSMKAKTEYDAQGRELTSILNLTTADQEYDPQRFAKYNHQGVIVERFSGAKNYKDAENRIRDFTVMTAKIEQPNISVSQIAFDHKNGISNSTQYLAYDYYSGMLTKSVERDLYENYFLNETVPAYRAYSGMGLKVNGINNKHMISQPAGFYVYKSDEANNRIGLISAKVQTWSNTVPVTDVNNTGLFATQNGGGSYGNVWRKHAVYVWEPDGSKPDGITPLNEFTAFNWANPASLPADWKKPSEITIYNVYSKPLEAKDINSNFTSTIMGYNESKQLISGSSAKITELAFSGAEDALVSGRFSGRVSKGDGVVQTSSTYPAATAHTGYNSLRVEAGLTGFNYELRNASPAPVSASMKYMASVWVKSSDGNVPNAVVYYKLGVQTTYGNINVSRKVGDWYQLSIITDYITPGYATEYGCINNGSSAVYFDDFRVQPLVSNPLAYVYDKLTGSIAYILDKNNMFTRFEYDDAGRLKATYKETFSHGIYKTGETEYNYGKGK